MMRDSTPSVQVLILIVLCSKVVRILRNLILEVREMGSKMSLKGLGGTSFALVGHLSRGWNKCFSVIRPALRSPQNVPRLDFRALGRVF